MYRVLRVFLFVCCIKTAYAQNNFELLWYEDFNSKNLDTCRWSNAYSWGRSIPSNHPVEYYTDGENTNVANGRLRITAQHGNIYARVNTALADSFIYDDKEPNLRHFKYTSGMARTKQHFLYGKFEVRCKLPASAGTAPAFWLFGGMPYDEIDVFERPQKFKNEITTNYHYDSAGVNTGDFRFYNAAKRISFSKKYHVFSLEWLPDTLRWYVDGRLIRTVAFHYIHPMQIILNLGIGNDDFWGRPPKRKNWSDTFIIDYVKVWRLKS
jgi:beta-glucanase (GH16 family)